MKRKLPLFLAMLMMVSILCAPMAYAAPADSQENPDLTEIDDPDVPLAEIPEVIIRVDALRSGSTSNAVVPEDEVEGAIGEVIAESAVRLTIISEGEEDASKAEVVMPGELIREMADTGVELNVVTPVGRALLSNEAFLSILHEGEDCDIVLVIEKKPIELKLGHELVKDVDSARIDGGSVTLVYVTCKHFTSYTWGAGLITLYLPIGSAEFIENNGYAVRQVDTNPKNVDVKDFKTTNVEVKDIETHVGQCVVDEYDEYGGPLKIAVNVRNGHLCYFVVLADAVEENMSATDPSVVVSPLASKTVVDNSGNGIAFSVRQWFDSVANGFMKLLGI